MFYGRMAMIAASTAMGLALAAPTFAEEYKMTTPKASGVASVSSRDKDINVSADGSVDVYFGPEAPDGMESNWIQTIPGKGWFMLLRLYGPLEPWFDQTWRPGEIELVSQ